MKQAFAVLAVLLFAVALHAQAPAVPPVTHFIVSGNAVGFNGAGGTSAASLDTAGIQVTANFSAGYEYLGIPAAGEHWEMGAVNYTRTASALLGQRITDAVFFNLKNINVSFVGRLGKLFQPKPTGNQFAEGAGVHISYPVTNNVSLQVLGVDWFHAKGQNGILTSNNQTAISTGIVLFF